MNREAMPASFSLLNKPKCFVDSELSPSKWQLSIGFPGRKTGCRTENVSNADISFMVSIFLLKFLGGVVKYNNLIIKLLAVEKLISAKIAKKDCIFLKKTCN